MKTSNFRINSIRLLTFIIVMIKKARIAVTNADVEKPVARSAIVSALKRTNAFDAVNIITSDVKTVNFRHLANESGVDFDVKLTPMIRYMYRIHRNSRIKRGIVMSRRNSSGVISTPICRQ